MAEKDAGASTTTSEKAPLPPLSQKEFRIYNRMAEQMDMFHNHHRQLWTQLLTSCTTTSTKSSKSLSPRQLILTGLQFCSGLSMHHAIEEQHIFPLLAKKMPEFRRDLVAQHRDIHTGLEKLEGYLEKCRSGEEDLDRGEVRRIMEGFGKVLWEHLDDEVKALGAENMRLYWSEREMRGLPM
ncbi:hypothetical protein N8T08_004536 [Aspergillus melleus]|uniref:Uncharacterized protein n=1 Tax=Aspergillus melleus TaxID=138277 RepID=A0ACC3B4J7_9EURO|nr:uncharacterized protein LDX57_009689 [Aspergillus melleus]KAH8432040.1 hypothetical protein LDX57_009689 [Aspergillus melleus]KAK1145103.1 hypothetical protein N8T08_004536 [Aspergillus melleus]